MVDCSPQQARFKEVNTVEVRYVNPSAGKQERERESVVRGRHAQVPGKQDEPKVMMISSGFSFYLVFGKGQSEPYSWTCMPKKHTSTPSISSNAKSALVL